MNRYGFILRPQIALFVLMLLGVVVTVQAAQMVEVALRSQGDMETLLTNGLHIFYLSDGDMAQVVLYDDSDKTRLDATGLRYIVLHRNLESYYMSRFGPHRDDMGGYRTYGEMIDELNQLHDDNRDIIGEPVSIGESVEGRDIWAVKLSDNPDEQEDEPELAFTSMIHADEVIGGEVLFGLIYHLINNYGEDDHITHLVDDRQIWIIPCHNPDGVAFSEEHYGEGNWDWIWRKNRRVNPDGSIGVDLNRNFGYMWGYDDRGSSPRYYSPTFRGMGPFSEPETRAIRDFVNSHNFNIFINFHACGGAVVHPMGYEYVYPPDLGTYRSLGERFTVDNAYRHGAGWEVMSFANGCSEDWLQMSQDHDPIFSFTVEIGTREDGHWPPRERVEPLVAENLGLCLTAIEYCDDPYRVLPPLQPENVTVDIDEGGDPVVSWEVPEDESNPPVSFNIAARLMGETFIDEVAQDQELWELSDVSISAVFYHSRRYGYSFDTQAKRAMMTLSTEIIASDTLWAWLRYAVNYPFALEVSRDGYNWERLSGSDTEDYFLAGYNHGPAILGSSQDWRHCWWALGDWAGQMVRLRFRYLRLGARRLQDYCYLDDVGPMPSVEWSEVVAEGVEESPWVDDEREIHPVLEYLVQSIDGEGDVSLFSLPGMLETYDTLRVALHEGWNITSINVAPPLDFYYDDDDSGPSIYLMTDQLRYDDQHHHIIIMKDAWGRFYYPLYGFPSLNHWDLTQGYMIKVDEDVEAVWWGDRIPADSDIPLEEGWNMIAYFPTYPLDASAPEFEVLSPIIDHVILAKDENGGFMTPEFRYSNMPPWEETHGYQVKVDEDVILNYPLVDQDELALFSERDEDFAPNTRASQVPHWTVSPLSGSNMSVLVRISADDELEDGSQIGAFSQTGELVGAGTIHRMQCGMAVWGKDNDSENGAGLANMEPFHLRLWDGRDGVEQDVNIISIVNGNELAYETDGFLVLDAIVEPVLPEQCQITSVYPNPFNSSVKLEYTLSTTTPIRISIVDVSGREAAVLARETRNAGRHEATWQAESAPSGVYYAIMEAEGTSITRKILLVR